MRFLLAVGTVLLGAAVAAPGQITVGESFNIPVTCSTANNTLPTFMASHVMVDFPTGTASFTTNADFGVIAFLQSQNLALSGCTSSSGDNMSLQGATIASATLVADSGTSTPTAETIVVLEFKTLVVNGTALPTSPSSAEEKRKAVADMLKRATAKSL